MMRTAYVIKGLAFEKPADLPEGYTVEEVEVADPRKVEVTSDGGNTLTVGPWWGGESLVALDFKNSTVNVLLSLDAARQVRDCLNAILDDAGSDEVTW